MPTFHSGGGSALSEPGQPPRVNYGFVLGCTFQPGRPVCRVFSQFSPSFFYYFLFAFITPLLDENSPRFPLFSLPPESDTVSRREIDGAGRNLNAGSVPLTGPNGAETCRIALLAIVGVFEIIPAIILMLFQMYSPYPFENIPMCYTERNLGWKFSTITPNTDFSSQNVRSSPQYLGRAIWK